MPVPAKVTKAEPVLVIEPKSCAAPALNAIVPEVNVLVVAVRVAPKPDVLAVLNSPPFNTNAPAPDNVLLPAIKIPGVFTLKFVPEANVTLEARVTPPLLDKLILVRLVVVFNSEPVFKKKQAIDYIALETFSKG